MSDNEVGKNKSTNLKLSAITRRLDALFKAMSTDFLLREQFVTDPAQITSEYVYGTSLSPQKSSLSNQLLYSVMSNPKLLQWLQNYSIEHHNHPPSHHEFLVDFGQAIVKYEGHHVVFALIRSSLEKESAFSLDDSFLQVISRGFGIFSDDDPGTGTEISTGTGTGTEISTGTGTGTEISTGTGTGTETSTGTGTGTETSTGTGTGTETSTGTGTGTETSTGTGTGTEISTGTGTGTEISTGTGTGTEISTGTGTGTETSTGTDTGTETSTGTDRGTEIPPTLPATHIMTDSTFFGTFGDTFQTLFTVTGTHGFLTAPLGSIFGSSYMAVTLQALVQYAIQLRESGALDVVWEGENELRF